MWNNIKEIIICNLDTIKIVLTIFASIFGVITGCDLESHWALPNHPFFDFVKWFNEADGDFDIHPFAK